MVNAKALGLSLGIIWGSAVLLVGWISMFAGWGTAFVDLSASLYIGYSADFVGAVIGGVWGFVDAGIAGFVVGWLYNYFNKKA